mgnify:CR=1 FL=1
MFDVLTVGFDQWHQIAADNGLEQLILARKIEVERALADTCAGSDVIEPCRGVSAFDKAVERGIEQFARAALLAALPAGRAIRS